MVLFDADYPILRSIQTFATKNQSEAVLNRAIQVVWMYFTILLQDFPDGNRYFEHTLSAANG